MNIWLITVGEPLPIDSDNIRLYRTGFLAQILEHKGHKVTWWTSSVNHATKEHRCYYDKTVKLSDNFRIIILHSIGYKRNLSFFRIINHYLIAKKFSKLALSEPKPDIILCSLPTLFLSFGAVKYGKARFVPVVLDIRDLWPDIFQDIFPKWARFLGHFALIPAFKLAHSACKNATALFGITPAFVDWGQKYANRKPSVLDNDFPLAYSKRIPTPNELREAKSYWRKQGLNNDNGEFIICFFGTMGRQFDLETVIKAARILQSINKDIKFVLCGSGDNLAYYEKSATDCSNILFPGWVQYHQIWVLMRLASVGLAPYYSSDDFMKSYPNKSIEYLSAGLPIVSSLKGLLQELLQKYNCGFTYENKNAEQLVKILKYLYNNPELLENLSHNALNLYQNRFIAENIYSEMVEHLEFIYKEFNNKGG